jgi:signal transduction histidine kinase
MRDFADKCGATYLAHSIMHAALRSGIVYAILIFAIALIFYGVESFIEYFARDIDNVVDIVMAIASTFIFLWIRAMMRNARLSETLRVQSEDRARILESRMGFLAEIAHEFQTPIAILRGNIAVLAGVGGDGGLTGTKRRRSNGEERVGRKIRMRSDTGKLGQVIRLDSAAGVAYADLAAGNRANAIYVSRRPRSIASRAS